MAAIPIVYTQLVPPQVKYCIKRPSLGKNASEILSHRVTTIVAPAGYGKSLWLSSLLEEAGWPPAAWLSLDIHDIEPSFLLYHLIYAAQRILPGLGRESLLTMNSLENAGRDWVIGVSAFISEIPADTEMLLVLDDFYLIDKSPAVRGIIEHLIRWLPAGIRLVLISRNSIPLNLYRERISNELLEIKGHELLFSVEETRELLLVLGLALSEEDVRLIHDYTEGWAAGLRLLATLLMQAGGDPAGTLADLKNKDTDLYTCLGNELLARLPAPLHDFMLDCSLLPYLEPDLCDASLACGNSAEIISMLNTHGILSRTKGEPTTWRLHHLMGKFLGKKIISLRPPDHITGIRQRAAVFLESRGDIDRALAQLSADADWIGMAGLIQRHGDRYFLQCGRLDALQSWLGQMPEEMIDHEPWLLFFKGMIILHGDPDKALDIMSRAADMAGKKSDLKCQLRALFLMIASYTFANNLEKVRETAGRIPMVASLLKNPWSRGVVLVAALSQAVWEDDLGRGVRLSRLAGKAQLDPETQMGYLMFSSMIQFRLGNLNAARELIEKALNDPYVKENERWTGTVYVIYSHICMLSGEQETMVQICHKLLRLGNKYNAPHQLAVAHRRLAHFYQEKGNMNRARQEFGLSRSAFIRANNIFMVHLTELDLILLRIKSGESARDLLPESEWFLNRLKTVPAGQGFDDYALSVAGIIALEAGQLEAARQRLEEVCQRCKQKGARHVLAGTRLLLARVHLLQGDDAAADICLRQALGAAEEEKWEYFWNWHAENAYDLCRRALLKNIHPYWAAHLLRRRYPQRTAEEAGIMLAYPDELVRHCTAALLQELYEETGEPFIHINYLGGFQVFVNGIEVSPSAWKNRKTESLFKLIIMERQPQLKEKFIDTLWPESEPRLGDASLRMALSHVRQALGLSDYCSESLILKRGMIFMHPKIKIYTDYELFISIAREALKETEADNPLAAELLEQVHDLYQGEFLPDNIYDDWTSALRTEMNELYMKILFQKIKADRRQGRIFSAIEGCRRYLDLEPLNEPVCRLAMELLWQDGQKQQALSIYKKLESFMSEEYNTNPSIKTMTLYERIVNE